MRLTRFNNLTKEYEYHLNNPNTSMVQDEIAGTQKLGQLEDVEEEFGIDLVTLFKAFKNGVYVKIDGEIDYIQYVSIFKKRKWHLYSSSTFWGKYDIGLVKNYGKTWALTRKELE